MNLKNLSVLYNPFPEATPTQLDQQNAQTHSLELALAAAQAKLEVQQTNWNGLMQQMGEAGKTPLRSKK